MTRRLHGAFERARGEARAALVAYLCAGDPDLAATPALVRALVHGGADVVELGVPFSDPVADGPVNQRAAQRALDAGTTPRGVLRTVATMREAGVEVPIVLFSYYNPIARMGPATFARQAAGAGVDGVLVVDLPPEEAGAAREGWTEACARAGIATVFLVAPTTRPERVARIAADSTGFVYCVARLGVTGARDDVPAGLLERLAAVRAAAGVPVAAGFGFSAPAQVAAIAPACDGVVVGSALVALVEAAPDVGAAAEALRQRVTALRHATHTG